MGSYRIEWDLIGSKGIDIIYLVQSLPAFLPTLIYSSAGFSFQSSCPPANCISQHGYENGMRPLCPIHNHTMPSSSRYCPYIIPISSTHINIYIYTFTIITTIDIYIYIHIIFCILSYKCHVWLVCFTCALPYSHCLHCHHRRLALGRGHGSRRVNSCVSGSGAGEDAAAHDDARGMVGMHGLSCYGKPMESLRKTCEKPM